MGLFCEWSIKETPFQSITSSQLKTVHPDLAVITSTLFQTLREAAPTCHMLNPPGFEV